MSIFDDLSQEVQDGMDGKNSGIPMGFARLNNHISIRKSNNYLLGGFTGSGKTALLDDAFVLNPVDWYIKNYSSTDIRFEVIYNSMERRKNFKMMKWISRRILLDYGKIIPVTKLMGWTPKEFRLSKDEHDIFLGYRDYIEAISEIVTILDGPQNPTGMRKYVTEHALRNGKIEHISEFEPVYIPNVRNKITLNIIDHVGLIKAEKDYPKGKPAIDKASEDQRKFRDFYQYSNVNVSQFNRDIASPMRIKNGDVEPMLEDFKETAATQEDADVVLSLFDPMRYKVADPSGYNLERLREQSGKKKYRSLKILKNSYGSDDIRIGLAFQPEIGLFKEMPKLSDTTESVYDDILDNSYFLDEWKKR